MRGHDESLKLGIETDRLIIMVQRSAAPLMGDDLLIWVMYLMYAVYI